MSDAARIACVLALCLLTPLAVFNASVAGLLPLGGAVWLIATAPWSRHARVAASAAAVAATIGLFFVFASHFLNWAN